MTVSPLCIRGASTWAAAHTLVFVVEGFKKALIPNHFFKYNLIPETFVILTEKQNQTQIRNFVKFKFFAHLLEDSIGE